MPLLYLVVLQTFLIACAGVLAGWIRMPVATLIGIGICGLAAILGGIGEGIGRPGLRKYAKIFAGACAILVPGSLFVPRIQISTPDTYYGVVAWLIAAAVFVCSFCRPAKGSFHRPSERSCGMASSPQPSPPVEERGKNGESHGSSAPCVEVEAATEARGSSGSESGRGWRTLGLVWAFIGSLAWLAGSYGQNQSLAFHFGLGITVALLIIVRVWFRLNVVGVQIAHTLILFLVGLPLVDVFIRPSSQVDTRPEARKHYYSYEVAKRSPVAFARWWNYYLGQWARLMGTISFRDPSGKFPYILRPGTSGEFFDCHVVINSKGFRGKEFTADKGQTFRIVAVGESTTFGDTMNAGDRPWPELLEEMILTRLHPARPVEVINAGVPGHTLEHTLFRLEKEILPLKPDMIVCYHGKNGLHLLLDALPRLDERPPPKYEPRPLKLLADAEYALKIRRYKKGIVSSVRRNLPEAIDPMHSAYARAYRTLIQAARTNDIRLAIGNFSMAVNSGSDEKIAEFYRPGFPAVHWQIQANALHAIMVRRLVEENPELIFVDTQPKLDGFHEKFVDLVHLTEEGRQEIAEAFYSGIEKTLRECLAKPARNSTANN